MAISWMSVARRFCRNGSSTMTTRMLASTSVSPIFSMDCSTNGAVFSGVFDTDSDRQRDFHPL